MKRSHEALRGVGEEEEAHATASVRRRAAPRVGKVFDDATLRLAVKLYLACSEASARIDGPIAEWDVSSVTDMHRMFHDATAFDGDLRKWDVSSVTNMSFMFRNATAFDGDLRKWDVSSVTSMCGMFMNATAFDGDLGKWDVSSVTNMSFMFRNARAFDGDLRKWDVSSVTNMHRMFHDARAFDGDLGKWDVSSVTNMGSMFDDATAFNGDLSKWDVSSVTNMFAMFEGATRFAWRVGVGWDVRLGMSAGETTKRRVRVLWREGGRKARLLARFRSLIRRCGIAWNQLRYAPDGSGVPALAERFYHNAKLSQGGV